MPQRRNRLSYATALRETERRTKPPQAVESHREPFDSSAMCTCSTDCSMAPGPTQWNPGRDFWVRGIG